MYQQSRQVKDLAHPAPRSEWYVDAMEYLVAVVQELSHARDLNSITAIVRKAARQLTGSDGATFVLRDGDQCHYADEDAISPLWKGQRFPMQHCISGWVMQHATPAVIEDIYQDPRVPHDAYRPTFVKSLVMIPIRRASPIGAIGNYWAQPYRPPDEMIQVLQALADTTSVALENAQLYGELREKVETLQESNYELSRFAWVASHDLQEPLRTIITQVELLQRRYQNKLDARGEGYIAMATAGAQRLQHLIDDLLVHAKTQKIQNFRPLSLESVMVTVLKDLGKLIKETGTVIRYGELPWVWGDPTLLSRLLANLISNAIKFQTPGNTPHIQLKFESEGAHWKCTVSDNGIGIAPEYHERIFHLFQRLHSQDMYPGSGIGLATCKKIVELHEGSIGVTSAPGKGSQFYFTLPAPESIGKSLHQVTQ